MTFKLSDSEDLNRRVLAYAAMENAILAAEEKILEDLGNWQSVRDGMCDAIEDYND